MQIFSKVFFLVLIVGGSIILYLHPTPGSYEPLVKQQKSRREKAIQDTLYKQSLRFQDFVRNELVAEIEKEDIDESRLQENFLAARLLYKKFEWAAEYFMAPLAERINGPPDQEVENADLMDPAMSVAIDPTGLQVIEEFIFPKLTDTHRDELIKQIHELDKNAGFLVSYFKNSTLSDWRILDAAKLQIFRLISLGITGFDNPLTLHSMEESAESLSSLRKTLSLYRKNENTDSLLLLLDEAIQYLLENEDFNSFDRAAFITRYANPISTAIAELETTIDNPGIRYNRMLNQNAQTLFEEGAFNVNAFAPGSAYHLTDARVKLGEKLFYENRLSGDGSRNCFTCHKPALSFTDGLVKNRNIYKPDQELPRNTPTLLNAALQSNYFYDMRALTLEDQALDVIQNPDEMDGNLQEITAFLNQDSTYRKLFSKAYPEETHIPINKNQLANALASYVRSLTFLNSRFDQYMRGDQQALTDDEIAGFNLYMGKAKCATCHFVPLFNGTTPPKYMSSETEVIGVPATLQDSLTDPDAGWYNIIGIDSYKHAFKTPTLRNIKETAPYMHNGVYNTLEEVMEFYNNAGAIGLGNELENNTLPEDSLRLSDREMNQIIKFMKSLSSKY